MNCFDFASTVGTLPFDGDAVFCLVPGCTVDVRNLSEFNLRCRTCTPHSRARFVVLQTGKYRFCQQCNKYQPLEDFEGSKRGCREKLAMHNRRRVERRRKNMLQKHVASTLAALGSDPDTNAATLKKLAHAMKKASVSEEELRGVVGECINGVSISNILAMAPDDIEGCKQPSSSAGSPNCSSMQDSSPQSSAAPAGSWGQLPDIATPRSPLQLNSSYLEPQKRACNLTALGAKKMEAQAGPHVPMNDGVRRHTTCSSDSTDLFSMPADIYMWGGSPPQSSLTGNGSRPLANGVMPPAKMAKLMLSHLDSPQLAPDQIFERQSQALDELECEAVHLCVGPGCITCREAAQGKSPRTSPGAYMQRGYQGLVNGLGAGGNYSSLPQHHVARISMKIDHATPDKLPVDLLQRVHDIVEGYQMNGNDDSVIGYIRPGCLQLTLDVPIRADAVMDHQLVQERAVRTLLDSSLSWSHGNIDIALPEGRIKHCWNTGTTQHLPPATGPELVMVQMVTADNVIQVSVKGWPDVQGRCTFHCRMAGHYVNTIILDSYPVSDELYCITLRLEGESYGLGWIEIVNDNAQDHYISEALPVLTTNNPEVCEEVSHLMECNHLLSKAEAVGVLKDVDDVLGYDERGMFSFEACTRLVKMAARCGWINTIQECFDVASTTMEMPEMLAAWPDLLLHSVQSCSLEAVAQVLSCYMVAREELPLDKHDAHGLTLLHWAALSGNMQIVGLLRPFDTEGAVWDSCRAINPPHLTPAETLKHPGRALPQLLQKRAVPEPPEATQELHPGNDPVGQAPHAEAELGAIAQIRTLVFLPIVLLAALWMLAAQRSWWSAIAVLVLGGLGEYLSRVSVPQWQRQFQQSTLDDHPELKGRLCPALGRRGFADTDLGPGYFRHWHKRVVSYDKAVFVAFVMKLLAYSFKLRINWLFKWSSPAVALLLYRCFSRQSARQQEISNMALTAYSWFCFWLGSMTQTEAGHLSLGTTLTLGGCLASSVSVMVVSFQYATVFPVRMQQSTHASLICCMCAFIGLQLRALGSPACQSWAEAIQCTVHSLACAVVPTVFGYLGAVVGYTWVEHTRIQTYFSASGKKSL